MKKIKSIAHISDIHIQLLKRHDEYRKVFKNLYKSLIDNDIDLIVICGDLFHSRAHLSPEAVQMATSLFDELTKISDVIIIAGNHDAVLTATNTRLDSISPIVSLFNEGRTDDQHKVIYYRDTDVYQYENVDFSLYSVLDYLEPDLDKLRDVSVKLGLYHGMLSGATLDSGRTTERDHRDITFDAYDRLLLGDIHKPQKIKNNAYYSGSLVQRNIGEDPKKHGYYIHDLEQLDKDPKFIQIDNEHGMYKIHFDGVRFVGDYHEEIPSEAYVRVTYPKQLEKKEVEKEFNDKYPEIKSYNIEVLTEEETERNIDIKENISELFSLENLNELIDQYYDDEETKEQMIELNNEIYEEVSDQIRDTFVSGSFVINNIEFDNLFSYGEGNVVDIKDLEGIIGLFSANRMGKSSFLNTIKIALYGGAKIVDKQEDMVNSDSDWYRTKISLNKNGDHYEIERNGKVTSSGISNKVTLYKNGESIGGTIREINKDIDSLFGDADTFDKLFYISQRSPEMFLDLTPMQRKEWVYNNLGVDIFQILHRFAKDKYNKLVSKVDDLKDINFDDELKIKELDLKATQKDLKKDKEKISDLNKTVEEYKEEIGDIEIIELENSFWQEYKELKKTRDNTEDYIENLKGEIVELEDNIKHIEEDNSLISINTDISEYQNIVEDINDKLENDEPSERQKNLEQELEETNEKGTELFQKKTKLKNNIKEEPTVEYGDEDVEELKGRKNELTKEKYTLESEVKSLKSKIENAKGKTEILSADERFENEELCKTCPLLEDAFEQKSLLSEYGDNLVDKEDSLYSVTNNIEEIDSKISNAETQLNELQEFNETVKEFESVEEKFNDLLNRKESLEDQIDHEKNTREEKLQDQLESHNKQIESWKSQYEDKKESLINGYQKDIEVTNTKIETKESELQSIEEKIEEYKEKEKNYQSNSENKERVKELQKSIDHCKDDIERIQDDIDSLNRSIGSYETEIENLKKQKEEFKEAKVDIDLYSEYSKITHKDELPLLFVENIIDVFQAEINDVISRISEFSVELEIEDNNINSYLLEKGSSWNANLCSGMERFIINIAFRIAISKIGNIVSPNFMIVDEGFNALDPNHAESVPDVFTYLKKDFDHIFVVSHSQKYKEFVDHTLSIEKVDGKSYISS